MVDVIVGTACIYLFEWRVNRRLREAKVALLVKKEFSGVARVFVR